MANTHYGDEDPECPDDLDPDAETELFETAKQMGWNPDDMRDKQFAAKYKAWLADRLQKKHNADGS